MLQSRGLDWTAAVQSLSHVQLFATPWTVAFQGPLSFTISQVCSNSCPLSQWCHPTISSSVVPFSSCLQSFPASGSFPVSQLFPSGGQSIGASAPASVLSVNIQGWFSLINPEIKWSKEINFPSMRIYEINILWKLMQMLDHPSPVRQLRTAWSVVWHATPEESATGEYLWKTFFFLSPNPNFFGKKRNLRATHSFATCSQKFGLCCLLFYFSI